MLSYILKNKGIHMDNKKFIDIIEKILSQEKSKEEILEYIIANFNCEAIYNSDDVLITDVYFSLKHYAGGEEEISKREWLYFLECLKGKRKYSLEDKLMECEKELFFQELRKIQDFAIGTALSKEDKYDSTEQLLEDVTYDVIWRICEMIDGYGNPSVKYNITNLKTQKTINEIIDLHNECEAYLRYTEV